MRILLNNIHYCLFQAEMLAIREHSPNASKTQKTVTVDLPYPGFQFDLCLRNQHLISKGFKAPVSLKTGTTIAGAVFDGGVVLGADTRATEGEVVADKNCEKIHYLAANMYCCGAGTAADTEKTTDLISSKIRLHSLNTGRQPRVQTALRMLKQMLARYGGHIGAYLVLGGVDLTGPHLYTVHAAGSTDKLPYVSMGSGSLAAMATFETGFKPGMSMEEAKTLVSEAIQAGILNDLGSGSNVDLCVITHRGVEYLRPYKEACQKGVRQGDYTYKQGTTAVLQTKVREIMFDVVSVKEQKMEID